MTKIGLPMPSGFTITTEVCDYDSAKGAHPGATVPWHGPSRQSELTIDLPPCRRGRP